MSLSVERKGISLLQNLKECDEIMHQKYLAFRSRYVNICSVGKSENMRQARWLTMLPNLMVSLENENTGQPFSNRIPLVSVASRHYRSQHRQG